MIEAEIERLLNSGATREDIIKIIDEKITAREVAKRNTELAAAREKMRQALIDYLVLLNTEVSEEDIKNDVDTFMDTIKKIEKNTPKKVVIKTRDVDPDKAIRNFLKENHLM